MFKKKEGNYQKQKKNLIKFHQSKHIPELRNKNYNNGLIVFRYCVLFLLLFKIIFLFLLFLLQST